VSRDPHFGDLDIGRSRLKSLPKSQKGESRSDLDRRSRQVWTIDPVGSRVFKFFGIGETSRRPSQNRERRIRERAKTIHQGRHMENGRHFIEIVETIDTVHKGGHMASGQGLGKILKGCGSLIQLDRGRRFKRNVDH
jgi:hypothetical protein